MRVQRLTGLARVLWWWRHVVRRVRARRLGTMWHDLRRARAMLRAPKVAASAAPRDSVVVALTTVPERIPFLAPVLHSLLDQSRPAERIVLAWPDRCLRTGQAYPPPPTLPDGIELLPCRNVGPATKVLPVLEFAPDRPVVVVDDDVIYPHCLLDDLLTAHARTPEAALGLRGWRVDPALDPRDYDHVFGTALRRPEAVDILLGTWGYLLPPGALGRDVHDFSSWPDELRWVDDVWISGHLARRGVPRFVIPARGLPIETAASRRSALTDGPNRSGRNDRIGVRAFAPHWGLGREPCSATEEASA